MELHKESQDRTFGLFGREPVGTKLRQPGFRLCGVQSAFGVATQLLQQFFRGGMVPESFLQCAHIFLASGIIEAIAQRWLTTDEPH